MSVRNGISGLLLFVSLGVWAQEEPVMPNLENQVADHERAFAQTMADRDVAAFAEFISAEGIFLSGAEPLRGREAVVTGDALEEMHGDHLVIRRHVRVLEHGRDLVLPRGHLVVPGENATPPPRKEHPMTRTTSLRLAALGTAATLAALMGMALPSGSRVLIPGGNRPRPELPDGLRERGLEPRESVPVDTDEADLAVGEWVGRADRPGAAERRSAAGKGPGTNRAAVTAVAARTARGISKTLRYALCAPE